MQAVFAPKRIAGHTKKVINESIEVANLGSIIVAAWTQWPGRAASLAQKVLTASPSEFNEW